MNLEYSRMRISIMSRWLTALGVLSAALLLSVAGCKQDVDKTKKPDAAVEPKKDNNGKPIEAQPVARTKDPRLLSFKEAVILDPPRSEQRPPDIACNGKNVAKIFEMIANDLWDKANFTDADGKRVKYQAVMNTDAGEITFDLYGDIAPTHVRSFVCLARAGYYDGMPFYCIFRRVVEDNKVSYIESGCPKGTGEDGYGSVGYWLRPEFSDKITHEEGVLGACLRETDDTAACRFYVTGAPMPQMDGRFTAFGKVSKGLDVMRTINTRAVDELDRPKEPVTIKSVTIQTIAE
jgi:cyclophilin family peptidyl-prolyl cis-trans isomerase